MESNLKCFMLILIWFNVVTVCSAGFALGIFFLQVWIVVCLKKLQKKGFYRYSHFTVIWKSRDYSSQWIQCSVSFVLNVFIATWQCILPPSLLGSLKQRITFLSSSHYAPLPGPCLSDRPQLHKADWKGRLAVLSTGDGLFSGHKWQVDWQSWI